MKYDGLRVQARIGPPMVRCACSRGVSRRSERSSPTSSRPWLPRCRHRPAIVEGRVRPDRPGHRRDPPVPRDLSASRAQARPRTDAGRSAGHALPVRRPPRRRFGRPHRPPLPRASSTARRDCSGPSSGSISPTSWSSIASKKPQAYFDRCIAEGAEGVMAKSLSAESAYRAGAARVLVDQVQEGIHPRPRRLDRRGRPRGVPGAGRRAGRYGALLVGVYNPERDRFESSARWGVGSTTPPLASPPDAPRKASRSRDPCELVQTGLTPDVLVQAGASFWRCAARS